MNKSKNADFAERLSTAADAKRPNWSEQPERDLPPRARPPSSGEGHGRRSGWLAMPASPSEKQKGRKTRKSYRGAGRAQPTLTVDVECAPHLSLSRTVGPLANQHPNCQVGLTRYRRTGTG